MERIVNNHILNYLLQHQLITRPQYGFMRRFAVAKRPHDARSCLSAV